MQHALEEEEDDCITLRLEGVDARWNPTLIFAAARLRCGGTVASVVDSRELPRARKVV